MNSRGFDSQSIRPLLNAQRLAVKFNQQSRFVFAAIVCLFCLCCPSTVPGLIVPVVVDSVERVVKSGTLAHIFPERLKGIQPPFADCDSALAVPIESGGVWPQAPIFHAVPRSVCWSAGFAVGNAAIAGDVSGEATTTATPISRNLVPKLITRAKAFVSAKAKAFPRYHAALCSPSKRENREPLKLQSCQVQNSVVEFRNVKTLAMINRSHDQFLVFEGRLWLEPNQRYSAARLASLYAPNVEVCNVAC